MLDISLQEPSEITMPRMTVQWQQPAEQNGIIRKYRLVFTYTIERKQTLASETNNQTFMYSLDVLGGIQYSFEIWAETVKPGPRLTGTKQVPEYSKYLFFSSLLLLHCGPLCLLMMCEYNAQKEIIMGTNAVADPDLEVRGEDALKKKCESEVSNCLSHVGLSFCPKIK